MHIEVQVIIDEAAAREKAEQFLARQDLKQHVYRFSNVTSIQRRRCNWGIVFDVYGPENTLVEGAAVIIVGKHTATVSFLS